MLAHLFPCENTPLVLQKSVGDLLVGGDFSYVSPPLEGQCSILSLCIWLVAATELCNRLNLKSNAGFRTLTRNCCEMVPRSGCTSLGKELMWDV